MIKKCIVCTREVEVNGTEENPKCFFCVSKEWY